MQHSVLIVNETPIAKDERCWLEARTLAQAGYRVSVVCPKEWRPDPDRSEREGVSVYAYPPPPQAFGLFGYAWELAYCWLRSFVLAIRLSRTVGFDAVHACNPPDTFFLLGACFKLLGKKYVFAQHDLCPELWLSRFGDRGLTGRVLHGGLILMERLSYLVADAVIVPNESYKRVAIQRGRLPAQAVFVVRNGPDLDKVYLIDPDPSLACGRRHLVCYLGIMNPQDGVDYLLRAIARLVHGAGRRDTQFALVGSGDMLEELKSIAHELEIEEYVTFVGWVSDPALLSKYLCTADVCVAPDPDTPLNRKSSFMKIMDYMAAATPTVAFDLPETRVSSGGSALYASPDDVQDLAEKMASLLDDPVMRKRMGQLGRVRIEEALSWKHQEPRLLEAYDFVFSRARANEAVEMAPPVVSEPSGRRPTGDLVVTAGGLPFVHIDSMQDKGEFLDFWRLPCSTMAHRDQAVSLVSAHSIQERHRNAVVLLPAQGPARLWRTGNGCCLYAPVLPIKAVPDDLTVVTTIQDERGATVSYVLEDPVRKAYYLPFSLDEAFRGFHLERYARRRKFPPAALLRVYYRLKPLVSPTARAAARRYLARLQERRTTFPEWPLELGFEQLKRFVLSLLVKASRTGELPFIWFWPKGIESCVVLTHDVENGLSDNPGIWRLIEAEKAKGLRSSFNVVPFKYEVADSMIRRLEAEGCEVGVHGHSHDGDLFRSRTGFGARAQEIDQVARRWNAAGFRSASTYRDADLLKSMEFEYDSSFFDTDPYEPQPGGCLSLYPYFIGDMVEIPITMAQDYTLFVVRQETDIGIWRRKLAAIREMRGMACVDAHPDEGYVGDEAKVCHYLELLEEIAKDGEVWNPLPRELASWWRMRRDARVVAGPNVCFVDGGTPDMCVRWARLAGEDLMFSDDAGRRELCVEPARS